MCDRREKQQVPDTISNRAVGRPWCLILLIILMGGILNGCVGDSWFDPTVMGRWENTPAVAPILDRLDIIESDTSDLVETTPPTAADLIPEVQPYIIGAGDLLTIDIFELFATATPYQAQRIVDQTGQITLPLIGSVNCAGMTEEGVRDEIIALLDPDYLTDAQVSVIAEAKRQNTYTVLGLYNQSGSYVIPEPRFLLLDAMAAAGGIPTNGSSILVIRQIPLSDEVLEGWNRSGSHLPEFDKSTNETNTPDHPIELQLGSKHGDLDTLDQMISDLEPPTDSDKSADLAAAPPVADLEAVLDSQESQRRTAHQWNKPDVNVPTPADGFDARGERGKWIYLDGQWMRVLTADSVALETNGESDTLVSQSDVDQLVTQRVVEIPIQPLLEGNAKYNIVVRPGDVIRVPTPPDGLIFMDGQIARPGPYNLSPDGKLTLTRAISAAGGLGPLGIPEKVDVVRMLPDDRQITVQLNLAAIYEMTEPDIYMKPGDVVNIGTTWYAAPLAVIRNGFRTTYGFGFLLDRNFGNDVFGPPPTSVRQ